MFSPMSSGRDRWEGGSEIRAPSTSAGGARPAAKPNGGRGKGGAFGALLSPNLPERNLANNKGKGRARPTRDDSRQGMTRGLSADAKDAVLRMPGVSSAEQDPESGGEGNTKLGGLRALGEKWRAKHQQQQDQRRDDASRQRMIAHLLGDDDDDRSPGPQIGRGARPLPQRRGKGSSNATSGLTRMTPSESSRLLGARRDQGPRPWWKELFRPDPLKVEQWLESWVKRWFVLAILPTLAVWVWCAMPFPRQTKERGHKENNTTTDSDAQFWFFLVWYYGVYCAAGLVYITQLFSLYRLNWWPAALGARTSYAFFWSLSLVAGFALHHFSLDKLPDVGNGWRILRGASPTASLGHGHGCDQDGDDIQWQRKTPWVALAFATMAMPALVCLAGLRRRGRQNYRHSLTEAQKTFLHHELHRRIPASYIRFLWFMGVIGIALVALLAGQSYASVFLSTLPHTGLDGTAYVAFWTVHVNLLLLVSLWILEEKVRSRALIFVLKYYYFMVYFIFYRNLFARLRSFDQFALIQLLSSFWICIWYPFSMTPLCHRIVSRFVPEPKSWEEWVENIGLSFYLRNLAQNTTMLAFLGWVSILHFGPNQNMYPFFAFADKEDPYNYQLTMLGSLAIWASEMASSFVARQICLYALDVDVTNLGLDEIRSYPELVTSLAWTSVHVLMDMLLFLVRLDFT